MIFYNVNPADNYAIATMAGNFQGGAFAANSVRGSAWWFLDQKEGMEWQLNTLSNVGLLSRFCWHVDGFAVIYVISAPRILPAHSLQHAWSGNGKRRSAQR